jgi:hypothetical protein
MYEVTIEHDAFNERVFTCRDGGELRDLAYRVARAQGRPVNDDRAMITEIGDWRSRADIEGTGLLELHGLTVRATPADAGEWGCEGHEDLDGPIGVTSYCDGSCVTRPRFDARAEGELRAALAWPRAPRTDAPSSPEGGASDVGVPPNRCLLATRHYKACLQLVFVKSWCKSRGVRTGERPGQQPEGRTP